MQPGLQYVPPSFLHLLTFGSLIYFLNVAGWAFDSVLHAGLIGQILTGMIYGPPLGGIIPQTWLSAFVAVGYLGLIFIVFEGGLTTDLSLVFPSLLLSCIVATTGVVLPIALSILLLTVGFKYTLLQGFSAGASLCSTSLGTTFAILSSNASGGKGLDLRRTRLGTVLLSAAIGDDIVGLIMAAIIPSITGDGKFTWLMVVRPVIVAIAMSIVIPVLNIYAIHPIFHNIFLPSVQPRLSRKNQQLFYCSLLVIILSGLVTAAFYAGTSQLLGAYIAGCLCSSLSHPPPPASPGPPNIELEAAQTPTEGSGGHPLSLPHDPTTTMREPITFHQVFEAYISPLLSSFLSPLFFCTIGFAIPFVPLWHSRVLWRGILYSILMTIAKIAAGCWYLVFPANSSSHSRSLHPAPTPSARIPSPTTSEPTRRDGALFLGLALVARGEVALLVATLARPGLGEEVYLIVMWATLVCTVLGAVSVGALFRVWAKVPPRLR